MLSYLLTGFTLGFTAALAPGPLQTLVISETMQHNSRAGLKVALAPLLTDAPVILFTVFILARIRDFGMILGLIAIGGAVFLSYLGYKNLISVNSPPEQNAVNSPSLRKAFLTNLLNPHPYLFWFSIGAPMVVKGYQQGLITASGFILGFYLTLVGTLSAIAIFTHFFQKMTKARVYRYVMRLLGLILFYFAFRLFFLGLEYLKIV